MTALLGEPLIEVTAPADIPPVLDGNADVDAAIEEFKADRKLTYKLAVEAHYDSDKGSYCMDGMNTELIRMHMPRWEGGGRNRHGWTFPEDGYDGKSTKKSQNALEEEDRGLYTDLGLHDLARRIRESREEWRKEVLRILDEKCPGYYTPTYLQDVRRQLGYPPIRTAHNATFEFGWMGDRVVERHILLPLIEAAVAAAIKEYDPVADMHTTADHNNNRSRYVNGQRLYVPALAERGY